MTISTYSTRSNARAAARSAAIAAGITAPLAGVHFDVTEPSEAPGRFTFYLIDTKTGEKGEPAEAVDASAAFDDDQPISDEPPMGGEEFVGGDDEDDGPRGYQRGQEFESSGPSSEEIIDEPVASTARPTEAQVAEICAAVNSGDLQVTEVQEVDVPTLPAPPQAPKGAKARKGDGESSPRENKKAIVLAMLASPEGATVAAIMERTGWLAHTTRAFISVTPKREGLTVSNEKTDAGRVYRTTPAQ